MQVICVLEELKRISTFNGQRGEVKVADVVLKSGSDRIAASAFDEMATKFETGVFKKGVLYSADLYFSVVNGENGTFQRCSINKIETLYDVSAF